jgi:uncharacterized membrane protein AbrB (regulator of aidB expression)
MRHRVGLALLLLGAVALGLLFQEMRLPAAWLFGPLVVSALFAVRGWERRRSRAASTSERRG